MKPTKLIIARIVTLAALAVAAAAPASAATFEVTTTDDGHDGVCDDHCTLREAIVAANADHARDVINLPPGTYRLSIPGRGENHSASGDLDILERVDLRGAGVESTIIDGGGIDRVLHIHRMDWWPGDDSTRVSNLTVTGGEVRDHDGGGGILVNGALSLEHVSVESNLAQGHHAVGGGIANPGALALAHVTVRDNVTAGEAGTGAGIWNGRGTASIVDSVISGNGTDGYGSHGAGLYSESGTVSLLRVTLSGNSGIGAWSDGGGLWAHASTFSIVGCTVSDNSAAGPHGGGGLWFDASTVVVINSTISGNRATGVGAAGAGIWTDLSTMTLSNCTLSGNSPGSALWNGGGTVIVTNTLVDGACSLPSGLLSGGGNLESPADSCGFDRSSDLSGVSNAALGLGPLADNGGPTRTHALLTGSAAIDNALAFTCPGSDQRGEPRPRDGDGDGRAVCDIGAFEASEVPPGGAAHSYWVPVAARLEGAAGSNWRTTLGALNTSSSAADLELVLRTSRDTHSMSATVTGLGQGMFPDIAGQLGVTDDKGTLEIRSDRPLIVTSRTFNLSTEGTFGQFFAGMTADEGLQNGESATLPQLVQNQGYRTNLGFANMGTAPASLDVTLYDGGGVEVGDLSVALDPGGLHQENEVYNRIAGRNDIDGGYAVVTVIAGSDINAYGSVIDHGTGDATTMPMSR